MTRRELIRNRGLLGVLARDTVSLTGSQMTALALPWFVLTTTGSASRTALDSEGFVPVVVALVSVQSVAALAFAASGLRERARMAQAVPA